MRVISQDGTMDVPYEMVVIQQFKNEVYFLNRNLTGIEELISDIKLAEYSTKEKAVKAMEMLRETYAGMPIMMQNVELTEEERKAIERIKRDGIIMVRLVDEPSKVECFNNIIFQFPQDSEIEVSK